MLCNKAAAVELIVSCLSCGNVCLSTCNMTLNLLSAQFVAKLLHTADSFYFQCSMSCDNKIEHRIEVLELGLVDLVVLDRRKSGQFKEYF